MNVGNCYFPCSNDSFENNKTVYNHHYCEALKFSCTVGRGPEQALNVRICSFSNPETPEIVKNFHRIVLNNRRLKFFK